jgi:Mn2+/Fe2+ NRAMP family transporter
MKKFVEIALGIVTSIGGFLEIGSIQTSMQAGAEFGFALLWAVILGTLCLIFLIEMCGRLAAVSHHTIADAVRERFGARAFVVMFISVGIVTLLALAAELGGVCVALQLATGIPFQWWALPVTFGVWLLLWRATFGVIEEGVALLGLVTLAFLVGAIRLHPSVTELASGLLPTVPRSDPAHAGFLVVSILGASLTPYLFYFYSSGAIEDRWTTAHLGVNRIVAVLGMTFGGGLSAAVLVVAAKTFEPRGLMVEAPAQMAMILTDALGDGWGFWLFVASLGIACLGAALEIALACSYLMAQGFGWNWGKNLRPREAARFSLGYTVALLIAMPIVLVGVDPLGLTNFSMALSALTLPFAVVPFLFLMNDRKYLGRHTNGWISNGVVLFVMLLAFVLALVSLPLEILGG